MSVTRRQRKNDRKNARELYLKGKRERREAKKSAGRLASEQLERTTTAALLTGKEWLASWACRFPYCIPPAGRRGPSQAYTGPSKRTLNRRHHQPAA